MNVSAHQAGFLLAGLAILCACHPQPETAPAPVIDASPISDGSLVDADDGCAPAAAPIDLDILVVVGTGDRSGASQAGLFDNFGAFLAELECALGAPPNLHLGAVSADLGAGGFDVPRCVGNGDDASLLAEPVVAGCRPADDPTLVDVGDGAGGRTRNFSGSIGDALECVGRVGTEGCAFEQPLAAAVAATAPGKNPGLLRDEAALLILFATGGTDCSATDPTLFDPAELAAFGPPGPFRCFEFGAVCAPDTPRTPGTKAACSARDQATPLANVATLEATLRGRKADPSDVMTAYFGGSPNDVVVGESGGRPTLLSSCPLPIDAVPPIRIGDLDNVGAASVCGASPVGVGPLAGAIADAINAP